MKDTSPFHTAVVTSKKKVPKKVFLDLMKDSYMHLDNNQLFSIVALMEKMLLAKQNGEHLAIGFRDWNKDGKGWKRRDI